MKDLTRVLLEAIVVGVFVIVFYEIVNYSLKYFKFKLFLPEKIIKLFLTGIVFHLIFEYTKINEYYSLDYCKNFIKK